MAKTPEKPKHKDKDEPTQQAPARPTAAPRQHVQLPVNQPTQSTQPTQPQPRPAMPRPVFASLRRPGDAQVPVDAQRVITALQQTVRSQAVLIRNYQELLRLEGREVEESEGEGEGEAA